MRNTLNIDNTKNANLGLLLLRVGIGVLFFIFGWIKIAGGEPVWTGVGGAMKFIGISAWPAFWGLLATIAEFAGGLLLVFGLFTRFAALSLVITMIVAVILKVSLGGGLVEYSSPLTMLLVNIFFLLYGGGAYSLDNYFRQRRQLAA
ncbi:DoxX family protein [Chitinophaga alhagiae]|uniref:DoxX family protein n=1 Tax=Chitinophaga alhagiae TaxID=2203219 RepID=A0ABN5LQ27_9BACT|nr:DoxX family protein [Chitinophaga alhagiae]AWO01500.1 DoxX family protein [Chitinophaga alhagiae]